MPTNQTIVGGCPKCDSSAMTCKYNLFESDELRIDSWEHKCPDCGHRETTAYRNDEEEPIEADANPTICPYCSRSADGAA